MQCTTKVVAEFLPLQPLHEVFWKEIQGDFFGELPAVGDPQLHATTVVSYLSPPPAMHIPIASPVPSSLPTHPLLPMTEDNQFFSPEGYALGVHMARACEGQGKGTTRMHNGT